jgi:hypothetical protein
MATSSFNLDADLAAAAAKISSTPDDGEHSLTLHGLPLDTVDALLTARGFEVEYAGTGYGDGPRRFYCVRTPNGHKLWHRSEALLYALVAETQR